MMMRGHLAAKRHPRLNERALEHVSHSGGSGAGSGAVGVLFAATPISQYG
jgi:hypothetical protein